MGSIVEIVRDAMWVLSLNKTETVADYLWIEQTMLSDTKDCLQRVVSKWLFENGFYADTFYFMREFMESIKEESRRQFLHWAMSVFIRNGQSRKDEFIWNFLLGQFVNNKMTTNNQSIDSLINSIVSEYRIEAKKFNSIWKPALRSNTTYDEQVLTHIANALEYDFQEKEEIIDDIVSNIANSNLFVIIFDKLTKNHNSLTDELYQWLRRNAKNFSTNENQISHHIAWHYGLIDFDQYFM